MGTRGSDKLFAVSTVYGKDGYHKTPYLTRIRLTPMTRWGQLSMHVFHRGDADPDPHDHPFRFWTFPLVGYVESVYDPLTDSTAIQVVKPFRIHYRPASHAHRVIGLHAKGFRDALVIMFAELGASIPQYRRAAPGVWTREGRIITLVWRRSEAGRNWGFWVTSDEHKARRWQPWRQYVYGEGVTGGDEA